MFDFLRWLWEQFKDYIWPFTIINVYERGVRLTAGKNPQLLEPGIKLKLPLIQEILSVIITPDTVCPRAIHVTTSDGKTTSIEPAIEFYVEDPLKWLIETNDAYTNLKDIVRGVVSDYVTDITWEEVKKKSTQTAIKNKLNKRCEEIGAKVTAVMLTDVCISRIYITSI